MQMTLPSHQREVTAHTHNLRGISSYLITAEEVAAQMLFVTKGNPVSAGRKDG